MPRFCEAYVEVVSTSGRSKKVESHHKVEIAQTVLMLAEEGVSVEAGKIDPHILSYRDHADLASSDGQIIAQLKPWTSFTRDFAGSLFNLRVGWDGPFNPRMPIGLNWRHQLDLDLFEDVLIDRLTFKHQTAPAHEAGFKGPPSASATAAIVAFSIMVASTRSS